jgi:hypothetical protein
MLAACLALLLSGCGGATMAPVKGRVLCKGVPVKEAALTFSPIPGDEHARDAGKPATGFTDADGTFILSTYRAYDGALIGPHRVLVVLDETNKARCKRETRLIWEIKPGSNDVEIELHK